MTIYISAIKHFSEPTPQSYTLEQVIETIRMKGKSTMTLNSRRYLDDASIARRTTSMTVTKCAQESVNTQLRVETLKTVAKMNNGYTNCHYKSVIQGYKGVRRAPRGLRISVVINGSTDN